MLTAEYIIQNYLDIVLLIILFVVCTLVETLYLRNLRKEFKLTENRLYADLHKSMKAAHRIISSYFVQYTEARISLLKSAIKGYPEAFNAWNALGYAYLQLGKKAEAIDAFSQAIQYHPQDKEGYCDLAYAWLLNNDEAMAKFYCCKAIEIDASAKADFLNDKRFARLHEYIKTI